MCGGASAKQVRKMGNLGGGAEFLFINVFFIYKSVFFIYKCFYIQSGGCSVLGGASANHVEKMGNLVGVLYFYL